MLSLVMCPVSLTSVQLSSRMSIIEVQLFLILVLPGWANVCL